MSTNTRQELAADPQNAFQPGDVELPTTGNIDLEDVDDATGGDGDSGETQAAAQTEGTAEEKAEATAAGWVDLADWDGPKEKWRPAPAFLEYRNHVLPVVQRENRELKARLNALELKDRQREQMIKEAEDRIERDSIKRQLREAREAGDDDKVDELTDKLIDMRVRPVQQPQQTNKMDPASQEAWTKFRSKNDWVEKDTVLGKAFARQLSLVIQTKTADSPEEALETARDEVRRMYPEKFSRRQSAPMADTGGTSGVPATNGKGWNDLKADVRSTFEDQLDTMHLTGQAREASKKRMLANCDAEHFRR